MIDIRIEVLVHLSRYGDKDANCKSPSVQMRSHAHFGMILNSSSGALLQYVGEGQSKAKNSGFI